MSRGELVVVVKVASRPDSGYILKVEPVGCAEGSRIGCEKDQG